MTHEEKINYLRIAAGICTLGFSNEQMDLLVSLYDVIIENKGNTDLEQIVKIESEVKKRADAKHRSELLDKVSEKI